jgi:hypothetical protein
MASNFEINWVTCKEDSGVIQILQRLGLELEEQGLWILFQDGTDRVQTNPPVYGDMPPLPHAFMPLCLIKHRNKFALAAVSEVLWNLECFCGCCYNHRLEVNLSHKTGLLEHNFGIRNEYAFVITNIFKLFIFHM